MWKWLHTKDLKTGQEVRRGTSEGGKGKWSTEKMSTSEMTEEMQIKSAGTMSHPADGQTSKGLLIPSILKELGKLKLTRWRAAFVSKSQ